MFDCLLTQITDPPILCKQLCNWSCRRAEDDQLEFKSSISQVGSRYQGPHIETNNHLHSRPTVSNSPHVLDCGRKPEERTHTDTGSTSILHSGRSKAQVHIHHHTFKKYANQEVVASLLPAERGESVGGV